MLRRRRGRLAQPRLRGPAVPVRQKPCPEIRHRRMKVWEFLRSSCVTHSVGSHFSYAKNLAQEKRPEAELQAVGTGRTLAQAAAALLRAAFACSTSLVKPAASCTAMSARIL